MVIRVDTFDFSESTKCWAMDLTMSSKKNQEYWNHEDMKLFLELGRIFSKALR